MFLFLNQTFYILSIENETDENQGAKPRCPIQHSKLRVKIFMKNFHGLIQEVWAKYKDEKLKISPITSPTIQPSSRCNESRQSQHLWSSMWKWRFSSFNFKACIVIRAPFNYLVNIVVYQSRLLVFQVFFSVFIIVVS